MKAKWWIPVGLAAVAVAGAATFLSLWGRPEPPPPRVVVNGTTFEVEVADTDATRHRGLGGRTSLPADRGMLFVFERPQPQGFYMKDCYFPIDIAFLDETGRIINLTTMAVEPDPAHPRPGATYYSDADAQYVLETVGGTWERIGAKPGMQVRFLDVPGGPP